MNSFIYTDPNGIGYVFRGNALGQTEYTFDINSKRQVSAFDAKDQLIFSGYSSSMSFPYGTKVLLSAQTSAYKRYLFDGMNTLSSFDSGLQRAWWSYSYTAKSYSASGILTSDVHTDISTEDNTFTAYGSAKSMYNNGNDLVTDITSCTLQKSLDTVNIRDVLTSYSSGSYSWSYFNNLSPIKQMYYELSAAYQFYSSMRGSARIALYIPRLKSGYTSVGDSANFSIGVSLYSTSSPLGYRSGVTSYSYASSYAPRWESGYPRTGRLDASSTAPPKSAFSSQITITGILP